MGSASTVAVEKLGVILEPTERSFEKRAVLNPGVYQEGEFVHLFYRAIDGRNLSTIGYARLKGPTEVVERRTSPLIRREWDYEKKGVARASRSLSAKKRPAFGFSYQPTERTCLIIFFLMN